MYFSHSTHHQPCLHAWSKKTPSGITAHAKDPPQPFSSMSLALIRTREVDDCEEEDHDYSESSHSADDMREAIRRC